ncbi:MAG: hypothetical protein VX764_10370 [Planctomycetota bacterium]|nr:hypothetical protein [Planctomycetota bacterium]
MAKRKPPRSRPATSQPPDNDELDFGDLTLGFVAAIVLPVAVAIVLGLIGMPVGGSDQLNAEQAELMRNTDRFVPLMTDEEAKIILDQVQYSVDNRAAEYIRRSRATDNNTEKNFWQEVSKGVLGPVEADLQRVLDEAGRNLKMSSQVKDAAQQWLTKVDTLRFQLEQEDPFRHSR